MKKLFFVLVFICILINTVFSFTLCNSYKKNVILYKTNKVKIIQIYHAEKENVYVWDCMMYEKYTQQVYRVQCILSNPSPEVREKIESGNYKIKLKVFIDLKNGILIYPIWIFSIKKVNLDITRIKSLTKEDDGIGA